MDRSSNKSHKGTENSMGILDVDNLKVFGEISPHTTPHKNKTSERLNSERFKALEAVQKYDVLKKHRNNSANKENVSMSHLSTNTPKLDHTDYVPLRRTIAINISDLITDETINLENITTSMGTPAAVKDVKISFEPNEFTGRSTLYKKELKPPFALEKKKTQVAAAAARLSVDDILASSFAPQARNLTETLRKLESTLEPVECARAEAFVDRYSSVASSRLSNFNGMHSLPRTADMSRASSTIRSVSEMTFNAGGTFSFSTTHKAAPALDETTCSAEEDFAPGEMMQSKLLLDEISWAEEYAPIPKTVLSKDAKSKTTRFSNAKVQGEHGFDAASASISLLQDDPNFSVGAFFNMRSDNICNIVSAKSPRKNRQLTSLVDKSTNDSTMSTTTSNTDLDTTGNVSLTPKPDNKAYSKVGEQKLQHENHDSKDSGNGTNNSYMLSLSAIDRALCNLNIHTDESAVGVINELLRQVKREKSLQPTVSASTKQNFNIAASQQSAIDDVDTIAELMLENKENLDPKLSDTLSFTESLLNCTDMKLQQQQYNNSGQSIRSPLSDIQIKITDESCDGDIDEWPSTPLKSTSRIVRRTKSPVNLSPNYERAETSVTKSPSPHKNRTLIEVEKKIPTHAQLASPTSTNTSIHDKQSTCPSPTQTLHQQSNVQPTKSLSTTLADGSRSVIAAENNFDNSPNLSKSIHTHSDAVNSRSSAQFDASPMSSPRSCIHSQASSPTSVFRSLQLDSTTNSERRYLAAPGIGVPKINSSPVTSESSAVSYARPYNSSSLSLKNGAVGRSVSRCSNSSEYSLRDGKIIPLKVTTLELSWASTKLRTDARKSMQVKNIANKRLVVRIEVNGPGFRIVQPESTTLTLQSQECRSISISFCPTVTGTAIGQLSFHSPHNGVAFLEIPLYGYGGHAHVVAQNIMKGPVGAAFLPMGDLCDLTHPLERSFHIYNKGPLLGFAIVCIDSAGLNMPRLSDAFEIKPDRMLISAGSMVTVRLVFHPKRDDLKNISKKIVNVLTLANMRIVSGDEANRQRIRCLVQRMSTAERAKLTTNSLEKLWSKFPDEQEMNELHTIRECTEASIDLLTIMHINEIALTLNNERLDESRDASSLIFHDADDTVLFRTICAASPTPQNVLAPLQEQLEDEHTVSSTHEGSWSVSPNLIVYDLNEQRRNERISLLIRNGYKSRQYFEVTCSHAHLLRFTPSDGYVAPDGGQIEIEITALREQSLLECLSKDESISIMVCIENERITVPVKLPKDNSPKH